MRCCPVTSILCDHLHLQILKLLRPTTLEKMHLQESIFFDLDIGVTRNASQYLLHHVTYIYAAAKFETVWSNGLVEMHLQENTLYTPPASCDLCSHKVGSFYGQRFRRGYNYKKWHARTYARTHGPNNFKLRSCIGHMM